MNGQIFNSEFLKEFKCKNGFYKLNVKYQYRINEDRKKEYRICEINNASPSFESFLIDEEEIINQIFKYFETF